MARVRSGFDPATFHPPLPGMHTLVRYGVPVVTLAAILVAALILARAEGPTTAPNSRQNATRESPAFQADAAVNPIPAPVSISVPERAQPPLLESEAGSGWRLLSARDYVALPDASEALLAIHWDSERPHVDVLDADGRITVRLETGRSPMARLDRAGNTLVVLDWTGDGANAAARLLVIDLNRAELIGEVALPARRVQFTTFANAIAVSADGQWAYWVEHDTWNIPTDCGAQNGQCDRMVVHAVDLHRLQPSPLFAAMPPGCVVEGMAPAGGSGIIAGCAGGPRFYIDDPAQPAGTIGQSQSAFHGGWAERDAPGTDIYLQLEIAPGGDVPSVAVLDKLSGGKLVEWPLADTVDVALTGPSTALVLRADGRLERLDLWTGDTTELPYAPHPVPGAGVALVR